MISAAQSSRVLLRSREVWMPPAALVALVILLGVAGDTGRELLRYDRFLIAHGEWWRLLSANFVHLGWWHLILNAAGIAVLVLLCPDRLGWGVWLRRLVLLSLGMSIALFFFVPSVRWYVGLSGVGHGLFLLGLGRQAWMEKDLIAVCCLAYLLGKIGWELFAGVPVTDEAAIGGSVLVESHLYGTLSAFIYGLAFRSFSQLETFSSSKD